MTNVRNPYRTWVLNTLGIVSKVPLRLTKVVLVGKNAGDEAIFYEWFESDTPTSAVVSATMATVTGQTMTSTGNFTTATVNPGQIIKITKTASTNNEDTFLIATNADANTITVQAAQDPTEETDKVYNWNIYEAREAIRIRADATEQTVQVDFPEPHGRFFQNLALGKLDTATYSYVNLYIA